jgi:hypothetical protein
LDRREQPATKDEAGAHQKVEALRISTPSVSFRDLHAGWYAGRCTRISRPRTLLIFLLLRLLLLLFHPQEAAKGMTKEICAYHGGAAERGGSMMVSFASESRDSYS